MKNLLEEIIYKGSTQFFCLLSIDYNIAKREVMIQVAPEGELKNNNRLKNTSQNQTGRIYKK